MKVCPSCKKSKNPKHYLCHVCWYRLSKEARDALWRKDGLAAERLRELYEQIQQGVPLSEIRITA